MSKKNPFETDTHFEISKHENEMFCHLNDLVNKTHPFSLEEESCDIYCDDCKSECNAKGILPKCHDQDLWESHDKVKCAQTFFLKQLLISHNCSLVNPLQPKKFTFGVSKIFTYATQEEQFYMNVSVTAD